MNCTSALALALEWEAFMNKNLIAFTACEQNRTLLNLSKIAAELVANEAKNGATLASSVGSHCMGLQVRASADCHQASAVMGPEDLVDLACKEWVFLVFYNRSILPQSNCSNKPFFITKRDSAILPGLVDGCDLRKVARKDPALEGVLAIAEDQVVSNCVD